MVALNIRYVAELVGSGRLGFVATNGLQDYLVIEGQQEDEYRQRIREGWRVAEILQSAGASRRSYFIPIRNC